MNWLGLGANVTGCLDTVVASCRHWLPDLVPAEEVVLGTRRFRVVCLLGEGGYSFVYLVAETTPGPDTDGNGRYALKKVHMCVRASACAGMYWRAGSTSCSCSTHPALRQQTNL
jgi:hypothetical protein